MLDWLKFAAAICNLVFLPAQFCLPRFPRVVSNKPPVHKSLSHSLFLMQSGLREWLWEPFVLNVPLPT